LVRLLDFQWVYGALPAKLDAVRSILAPHADDKTLRAIRWTVLQGLFSDVEPDGRRRHPETAADWEYASDPGGKRAQQARKAAEARWAAERERERERQTGDAPSNAPSIPDDGGEPI
jgi:hypothetical protein